MHAEPLVHASTQHEPSNCYIVIHFDYAYTSTEVKGLSRRLGDKEVKLGKVQELEWRPQDRKLSMRIQELEILLLKIPTVLPWGRWSCLTIFSF